jgi:hypothetical protein
VHHFFFNNLDFCIDRVIFDISYNQSISLLFLLYQTISQIYYISHLFLSFLILSHLFLSSQILLRTKQSLRATRGIFIRSASLESFTFSISLLKHCKLAHPQLHVASLCFSAATLLAQFSRKATFFYSYLFHIICPLVYI